MPRRMSPIIDSTRVTGLPSLAYNNVGWASWNIFTTFLFTGVKCILFEGVPYFLSPTYLWDLVDEFKLTELVSTPSVLDELEKRGYFPSNTLEVKLI
ncbi:UNVERIFIED_CONTAM: Acetoacetyl-CoA synthetase [Trichonephila clavipes]